MRYRVVTFGCRVNQADSLRIEEDLRRRGAVRERRRRRRAGGRQHLFGDRDRRSGRAPDDPPHRARQSLRADRRHRLLCDACAQPISRSLPECRPGRGQRRQDQLSSTPSCDAIRDCRRRSDSPAPTGRAARRSRPASPAGPPSRIRVQTGCDERCAYCIIPTTRGRGPQPADRRGGHAKSSGSPPRVSARSPSPACTSDRTDAISSRARRCWICCARSTPRAPTSCSASARSSRWTARPRSSP